MGQLLQIKPDVVLVSAYTMYRETCRDIALLCQHKNVPLLIGGSSFVLEEIRSEWLAMPGVTAVYAGEPEAQLGDMVRSLIRGDGYRQFSGLAVAGQPPKEPAPPLAKLDEIPIPDFIDFPWNCYPNRIIPMMTGRGCEWGRCTFCSDVITASGRTYRSRSLDNVMFEIESQQRRFEADLFVFLDLKLNSNLELWRGLSERIPALSTPLRWTASVHVDTRPDNGLSFQDLKKAADAGLVRITCGLESASNRLLKQMAKGIKLSRMSNFIKDASAAGISVRLTCIIGYPDETAEDVQETADFLKSHTQFIERVTLNRFANMPGTPIEQHLKEKSEQHSHITLQNLDTTQCLVPYQNSRMNKISYLVSAYRLIKEINVINCKPLLPRAAEFEGAF